MTSIAMLYVAMEHLCTNLNFYDNINLEWKETTINMKIDRFNEGLDGRNIIAEAMNIIKKESIRSYVKNAQHNNMPISGLTSLITSDNFLF